MLKSNTADGPRWTECLSAHSSPRRTTREQHVIGVLHGEGIGPEVIQATLEVLDAVRFPGLALEICEGPLIGHEAEQIHGTPLPDGVI
jgi:isocitrate/isopropylmalate dehydrogenase